MNTNIIVLAAGKGTRMKSKDVNHSKVSFPILGKPLVKYVLDAAKPLNASKTVVVVGFGGEATSEIVKNDASIVWQKETLGTGHAVMMAEPVLKDEEGQTLILCGDTPLLTSETLQALINKHQTSKASLTVLTSKIDNPKGYGRIIRDENNKFLAIREDKDCSDEERLINEMNAGVYVFDNQLLFKYLKNLKNNNAQGEYYLTDLISMFVNDGLNVDTYVLNDAEEVFGINDRCQLAYANKVIRKRVNKALMLSGVTLEDPDTTYIAPDVKVGQDTIIRANTQLLGNTVIGEDNVIGPNSYLENVKVGNNNQIISSYLTDCEVGNNNELGPYLKARTNTHITDNCRVGNFVELKNAILKPGVKCAHLSYLGDSEVGERTNIGCMSVTANYDGYNKSRTTIGKDVFIGSGTILVAPITVEDEGFTAAGSTITKPVLKDELAIERVQQVNIKSGSSRIKAKAKAIKEAKSK